MSDLVTLEHWTLPSLLSLSAGKSPVVSEPQLGLAPPHPSPPRSDPLAYLPADLFLGRLW